MADLKSQIDDWGERDRREIEREIESMRKAFAEEVKVIAAAARVKARLERLKAMKQRAEDARALKPRKKWPLASPQKPAQSG